MVFFWASGKTIYKICNTKSGLCTNFIKNNTENCSINLIDNAINRYFIDLLESLQVIDLSVMLIAYLR